MRGNAHLEYNSDFNYKWDEMERCNIDESAQGEKSMTRRQEWHMQARITKKLQQQ